MSRIVRDETGCLRSDVSIVTLVISGAVSESTFIGMTVSLTVEFPDDAFTGGTAAAVFPIAAGMLMLPTGAVDEPSDVFIFDVALDTGTRITSTDGAAGVVVFWAGVLPRTSFVLLLADEDGRTPKVSIVIVFGDVLLDCTGFATVTLFADEPTIIGLGA